jgi:hypothetical protein
VAIPLSEIWQVKIMKTNTALTILAALGTGGLAFLAWGFSTIKD